MVDGPPQPADDDNAKAQQRRVLVWRLAGAGLLILGFLVVYVFWLPRWMYPSLTGSDLRDVRTAQNKPDAAKIQELKDARLKLQNDARTTLLQGLGAVLVLTGAGIGAAVTLRQIRVSQGQLQTTREQMEHTLESTRQQLRLTEQGQVTDRYTRAVEQLGHEKAPVRLGALYSLERLAQNNSDYRETVVDVFCAYLRMPYTPSARNKPGAEQVEEAAPPADDRDRAPHHAPGQDPAQEHQVRQTAQRLLAAHLQLPAGTSSAEAQRRRPSPRWAFWPGISLDLTGATLIDFDFKQVSVVQARFGGATFQGDTGFNNATFHGDAWFGRTTFNGLTHFDQTTFQGDARFPGAAFQGSTWFNGATFEGSRAWFNGATFHGYAGFNKATFHGSAVFGEATFQGSTQFNETTFQGDARFPGAAFQGSTQFNETTFQGLAWFHETTFHGSTWFNEATFQGDTGFEKATFQDNSGFAKTTFQGDTWFEKATFRGRAWFDGATFASVEGVFGARVLHLDDPDLNKRRVWPDGFTVHPDPGDPTRGTLIPAEQAAASEPVVSPPDHSDP
jgi:uncharacterized protein YjbI with pentapeptide repeats